ncbi:hypothetical protein M3J09_012334 [Ascochyta lentis]
MAGMNLSMSRCTGTHRKTPGLGCELTSESGERLSRPLYWTLWPRKGGCTDRSDARLIRLWIRDVFLFPCQARESGLPVAASPVPAVVPAWLQGRGWTDSESHHSWALNQMLPDA